VNEAKMAMLYLLFIQQCSTHTKIGRSEHQTSMDKIELPTAIVKKKKKEVNMHCLKDIFHIVERCEGYADAHTNK
jgi:hypothetical protein